MTSSPAPTPTSLRREILYDLNLKALTSATNSGIEELQRYEALADRGLQVRLASFGPQRTNPNERLKSACDALNSHDSPEFRTTSPPPLSKNISAGKVSYVFTLAPFLFSLAIPNLTISNIQLRSIGRGISLN